MTLKLLVWIFSHCCTCSLGPKLHSGLGEGRDLANSIHRSPNGAKTLSLRGSSIGKQSGCLNSGLITWPSLQHDIPLPLAPNVKKKL